MKDTWGEAYINLALRVEKHFEGFVDAFCGPPSVKARIEKEEPMPLDALFDEADNLAKTLPSTDKPRKVYLEKQMTGIMTTIQILQGEEIGYKKQVELFFDIVPEKIPDSEFAKQRDVLYDILRKEPLCDAVEKWHREKEVPQHLLQNMIDVLHSECRARTAELLSLPEGEHVDFVLVNDKPWSGYNWYLSGYHSRVEINTDIPSSITSLPSLVSHEAYPGHHTEHTMKEKVVYKDKGLDEACVFVYNTPECLISEGIANAGFGLIFENRAEAYEVLNDKMDAAIDVEADAAIAEALNTLSPSSGNASLMLHEENCDTPEVVQYLMDTGLFSRKKAEKQVEFMTNPLFRAYIFNYFVGKDIVCEALKRVRPEVFYEYQVCPSNLKYFTQ
jgi:hypothetical protein